MLAVEVGLGVVVVFTLVCACRAFMRKWRRRAAGYSGVLIGDGAMSDEPSKRVCFELHGGLREEGELSLAGVKSIKHLRLQLLQLADELLLDPEDDLGEWTLRYTDTMGELRPVTAALSVADLRRRSRELRVTAGRALRPS